LRLETDAHPILFAQLKDIFHPLEEGARTYTANFSNSYLIRGVIKTLREAGFIPDL